MGIWIRSQDRKTLTNANDIYIHLRSNGYAVCTGKVDLGVYSSEEKAVKVLDSIRAFAEKPEYFELYQINTMFTDSYFYRKRNIYDMPQDNEVDA